MTIVSYGHEIPPFKQVFINLFRAGLKAMSLEQVKQVAAGLSEEERTAMGDYLGEEGIPQVIEGLPEDILTFVASSYVAKGTISDAEFKRFYPHIMVTTNSAVSPKQLETVIKSLSAEEIASQSLYLGDEGRAYVFSKLPAQAVQAIMDHTEDWVFLETGKRAIGDVAQYSATLLKNERVGGKLQGEETITLKVRHFPRSVYMKWLAGPFKGRELIYNENVLGYGKVRVREGGLLGVVPVTLNVDSPVAKRGTNHLVTEVGFAQLLGLVEKDYLNAAPKGHIKRINHGITKLDGLNVYKVESVLPRDSSLGYYCHRMIHYTDYVRAFELKSEVFNFQDEIQETYFYKDIDVTPGFTDLDFDPRNKAYKL